MILDDKNRNELGLEFDTVALNTKIYCQCDYCGKICMRSKRSILAGTKVINTHSCGSKFCTNKKREDAQMKLYGVKNAGGTEESIDKKKNTWVRKYGVDNINNLPEIKEKTRHTNMKKYGAKTYTATDECKEKVAQHNLEKYGVKSPAQAEIFKEKTRETNRKKYGVDYFTQTSEYLEKTRETNHKKYGVKNYAETDECKEKMRNTNMARHGVEYALQSPVFRQKMADTNLERHGVYYATQNKEISAKAQQTNLEKYGFTSALQNEEIKEKMLQTNSDKYGAKSYLATDECKEKTKKWCMENFGVEFYAQTDECKNKSRETSMEKYGFKSYSSTIEFKERYKKSCMEKYNVSTTLLIPEFRPYGKAQNEIKQWLLEVGFNFNTDHSILSGKEIDLYNDDLKFGIEYCGLYWHNEMSLQPRMREYHYNKYKKCLDSGVSLITMFEDEWILNEDCCKDIIKAKLGIYEKRIYARKCKIKELNKNEFDIFCEQYHIQGKNSHGIVFFGLFYNDELLGVISLGHHPRKKLDSFIVLDRLCFKYGTQIIGGASKLFNKCTCWAKQNSYKNIISWSDNRWGSGQVYKILGFNLDKQLPADYSYVDMHNMSRGRLSKQSQKKSNTKCPKDKTEHEWSLEQGLARIWDCGKKRWVFSL